MYSDQVERDSPVVLFDTTNTTYKHIPPIIAGKDDSIVLGGSDDLAFEETGVVGGTQNSAFSLEAWILPYLDDAASILAGGNGGLFWSDNVITFSIILGLEPYVINYEVDEKMVFHVVGVYDGASISLYVNGRVVDRLPIDVRGEYLFDDTMLVAGTGLGRLAIDGIAIYDRALAASTIRHHYNLGRSIPAITTNISQLGALIYNLEDEPEDIGPQRRWGTDLSWQEGTYGGVSISGGTMSGSAGSEWKGTVPVPFLETVKRSRINWFGEGDFIVQTSVDNGTTWDNANKLENIPNLANATNQYNIDLKISFLGEATITSLDVTLYISDENYPNVNVRPIKLVGGVVSAYGVTDQIEYRQSRGAGLSQGHLLLPLDPNDSTPNIRFTGLDIWLRLDEVSNSYIYSFQSGEYLKVVSGQLQSSGSGQIYINGAPGTSHVLEKGEWMHVMVIFSTPIQSAVVIGSNFYVSGSTDINGQIGSVTLYTTDLDESAIERIYRSYFGGRKVRIQDESSVSVLEPENAWDLYNYDWSAS